MKFKRDIEKEERKRLKALYPRGDIEEIADELKKKRRRMVVRIVVVTAAAVITAIIIESSQSVLSSGDSLDRGAFGEGDYQVELYASFDNKERENEENGVSIEVDVSERELRGEELDDLMERAYEEAKNSLKAQNGSFDEVRYPLDPVSSAAEGEVGVEWEFSDYTLIDSSGRLNEENIPETGAMVDITAKLTYRDNIREYSMYACVYPPVLTDREVEVKAVEEALDEADRNSIFKEKLTLPTETSQGTVSWSEKKDGLWIKVLFLSGAIGGFLLFETIERLKSECKKRNDQLLADYSGIVEKLALLIGAGMTVRGAFERIGKNYVNQVKTGAPTRYAYEELIVTCYRLRDGLGEAEAFDDFGKRCDIPQYRKLANLITQNLKLSS